MKVMTILSIIFAMTFSFISVAGICAENIKTIKLPAPQTEGGKPLMQVLKERRSLREFSPKKLPIQVVSDMLWAACGINRPESVGRTAPTAKNMQEINIYVARADGLYLYDPIENELELIVSGDIRGSTGKQEFVKDAPVNLIYVADLAKMAGMPEDSKDFYAAADTGCISQNVYLYCASAGLATVVRGWVDKPALAKAMKLGSDQKIVLAQTVGYPKE
jgi:SagB-type dehydrogenase family enzyme